MDVGKCVGEWWRPAVGVGRCEWVGLVRWVWADTYVRGEMLLGVAWVVRRKQCKDVEHQVFAG